LRTASATKVPVSLGTYPGLVPRLIIPADEEREDLRAYEARSGYGSGLDGEPLVEAIESSGLRGRGGAAFPAGVKLRAVAGRPGPRFVVANGEEGEPASVKDRWLLRVRPHLVLDGMLRTAELVGAERCYFFVSDRRSATSISEAIDELGGCSSVPVELVTTEPRYVAGEETAVVRAINGGPALPLDKPPRPFESGVGGSPTLVANVETLANIPWIARHGAASFRDVGTERSPGTFLLTISGACERPGLHEIPFGITLGDALRLARPNGDPVGFLMGGFFAGLLGRRAIEARLTYDELRDEGSGLGCGAIVLLGAEDCPVAAAADVMDYFARENAKQCGACIRGTVAMRDTLMAIAGGTAEPAAVDRLRGWSLSLRERGACALLDGAAGLAGSLFREFPDAVDEHLRQACPRCAAYGADRSACESRFALSLDAGFR
jgi:NADH:ubiquinone oxidoreductase subunit F (NADH-binding)